MKIMISLLRVEDHAPNQKCYYETNKGSSCKHSQTHLEFLRWKDMWSDITHASTYKPYKMTVPRSYKLNEQSL